MRQEMINRIVSMEEEEVPTLFKPVQFEVIKKLKDGKKLNENEKRYLRGKIRNDNKIFKFIRVKSIQNYKYKIDNRNKYASNEQISKDVGITKNKYVELICKEMFSRYGKMFSRTYRELLKPIKVDYSNYGV